MDAEQLPAVPLRETCRLVAGAVALWPYHRQRLASGGCGERALERADAVVQHEARTWSGPETSRLRLTVSVTTDGSAAAKVQRRLSSLDVPGGPIAVPVGVDGPPPLPANAAKPYDRSWWDVAQRLARTVGGHQAIIVRDRTILDGGTATVWLVLDSVLCTGPAPDAVAGVARAFVLDRCIETGIPVRIGEITMGDFERAEEAFLTNAYAGAVAVRGRGGPVCGAAQDFFDEIWRV